jgi:UbiD family decarboxylase
MKQDIYDLRSFIERLEEEGELVRVRAKVDWKFEVGGIAYKAFGPPPGPALLFENIQDYTIPLFLGGLQTIRRIAIALGLAPETDHVALIKEYAKRLLREPIKPVTLKDGPCKENKYFDNDVDIFKFPIPWLNEKDGGRYIGTWNSVVTKDPDTGWTNVGTYRMQAHEKNICGIHFAPFNHINLIYQKYVKMNRPMPIAVVIGMDPVAMLASASPFPAGVNEWDIVGALKGRPLEIAKGETVDLEVPTFSEIVLEGEVPPFERREEGPFGEHTGYYGGGRKPAPIMRVRCITHRDNPIFRCTYLRRPVDEEHQATAINHEAHAFRLYKAYGFPGVVQVSFPAGGDPWFSAIIAIKKTYISQGMEAARLLLSDKTGRFVKLVIVVDEDINVFDLNQVLWALNIRFQASRDICIFRNESGSILDPSVPREFAGVTDKIIMDATWPTTPDFKPAVEWGGNIHPPEVSPSEDIRNLIEKRWKEYGLG